MQNVIIAKSIAGVWSFQKSSNGTLADGTKYTGPKITVGSEKDQLIINNDGNKMYFGYANVYYKDTNYTTLEEVLEELATDGLAVNFNMGGATPQILYGEEGVNENGAMNQKATTLSLQSLRASLGSSFVGSRISRSTNQSIPTGSTYVDLVLNASAYQENGVFWTSGANVTIPESGYYNIVAEATFDGTGLATVITASLQVLLNGTTTIGENQAQVAVNSFSELMVVALRYFNAGDILKIQVKHTGVSAVNVIAQGDHSPDIILAKQGGVKDSSSFKIINDIKNISNGFDYSFDDRAGYTSWQPLTYSAGTTKGIRIVSTGGANFINTGKFIDNSIGVITLTCKTVNASSIFGFGVKNGSTFEGATWYGSNGRFVMQDYNSTAEKTGVSSRMTDQPTYGIGNVLSIRMIFAGNQTYLQTIIDGVEGELVKPTASNPILSGGELVLIIKGAITLDDYYINIERNENPNFYVSPTGLDTNNGTYNSPFARIKKAKKLAKNYGNIILKHGDHFDQSFDLAGGIKVLEDVKGTARLIYGTRFTSASFTSGSTKVYEVPYATTLTSGYILWQHGLNDPLSLVLRSEMHPLQRGASHRLPNMKCTWLGSVALLEASDSSRSYFFWSAGKLYFTIASGSNLTANPIVIPDNLYIKNGANIATEDYCRVKIRGLTIMYRGLDLSGTSPDISELTLLCSGGAYGIQAGNAVDFSIRRCRAGGINYNIGIGGDAFNLTNGVPTTNTSKISTGVFTECWGHDCEDDGITCHGFSEGSIIGGVYEYNGNGISTASGGHFSMLGTISRRNGTNMSTGGAVGDGGVGSNMYAKNCTFENPTGANQVTGATGDNVIVLDQCHAIGTNFASATTSFIQKACTYSAT